MNNGIWISPDQFVQFGEKAQGFSDHIVTRDRAPDFSGLGSYLPNPDPILKAQGKDVSVYRSLRGHAAVGGAIRRRKAAVTALESGVKRGNASARVEANIKAIIDDIDVVQFTRDVLEATLYGFQPIELLWNKGQRWTIPGELIAKPPEWFTFSTKNELRFRSRQSPLEGEPLPERKFLLPRNDATYQNPWGVADLSMVFWPATFMKGGLRFWVQFAEKYGTPWLVGKVPRNTNRSVKNDLAADLEAMIQDAIAVVPDDSSVDIIEAGSKAGAADAYEKLLKYCRSEINIALLGQNQTTESNSTNASATAGLEVADDLRDSDAGLVCSTMNTLIEWIMYANGMSGPAPKFDMWEQEQIDDVQAKRDQSLTGAGVRFTKKYWMRTYDLNDDDLEDTVKVEPKTPAPAVQFAEADAANDNPVRKRTAELSEQLMQAAADPLRAWLEVIRGLVAAAGNLDALHTQLLEAYESLDAEDMTTLFESGFMVAQARGIEDVATEAGQSMGYAFAEPTAVFAEQLAALQIRLRNLVPTTRWTDLQKNAHDRAFVVAGAKKADLLNDLASAVMTAIQNGGTIESFRADFDAIIDRTGWSYNGERNWRTRVIYSTNMSSSYHAGRLSQLNDPDLQAVAPFRMYRHGGSAEPRQEHLKWDKITLPATDPWWDTHYTPNGFGCSCYVIAASHATAERMGGRFETPPADLPGDIGEGWDYAPGANSDAEIRLIVERKLLQLPQVLARAYADAWRAELGRVR